MSKQYVDFYTQAEAEICRRSCPVMNARREEALHVFSTKGFPTKKVEEYRYTDVGRDFAPDYGIQLSAGQSGQTAFCHTIDSAPIDLGGEYGCIADTEDGVVALNTMLATEGLLVYVPEGVSAEQPIQISNVLRGEQDTMVNRRMLIVMGEGSEASVIITDHASGKNHFLSNQVIEVHLGRGSRLNLYEIEETNLMCTHYSSVFVKGEKESSLRHTAITLLNGRSRHTCRVRLSEDRAMARLSGCVIADKMQHVDHNLLIEHMAPECTSEVLYKYVLDDSAFGAFAGKVLVREGAQGTVSSMTNANLLSTRQARMLTQPMLEIYADDVRCSHGSTVGQMSDQALFYMQQRGIPYDEARMLLKSAFITEVIEDIPLPALRDRLHYTVDARLRGHLSKCEGCKLC